MISSFWAGVEGVAKPAGVCCVPVDGAQGGSAQKLGVLMQVQVAPCADRAGVDDHVGGKHLVPLGQDVVVLPRLEQVLAQSVGGHEVLDGDAVQHVAEVLLEGHWRSPLVGLLVLEPFNAT
jgi:hypothetical protein